jgi:hypothetical protein
MSVNSIGSSVLGTDLTSFLASRLNSEGIKAQSSAGEVTTTTADGGSVTSIGTGPNAKVVSETSSDGTTLTEVGYESPVLVQNFLNSLEQALQSDGLDATSASAANPSSAASTTSTDTSTASGNTNLASSIQSLLAQLGSSSGPASANGGLLTSFNSLLQGSGIDASDASGGSSTAGTGSSAAALQAFLSNALSGLPTSRSLGQSVNASA